eukprot:gene13497-15901_t
MKINTDGVLLGALAVHDHVATALDIGTGTGVIAMMLAQRFEGAVIDAVEIEQSAAERAADNFLLSPFAGRLKAHHQDINDFDPGKDYDLIVSNPPYFVKDLKNPEPGKRMARHADESFFELLIRKVALLLKPSGCFWVILPLKQAQELVRNAVLMKLFPLKVIHVYSDADKAEFRQILCFSFVNGEAEHENFYIYLKQGVYTEKYRLLLKDFFLAF